MFGIKDHWWKQVYDGKYHSYGPDVFDEGLHEKNVEPGYFASIKKATEYVGEHLGEPLILAHYKKIHELACSHFPQLNPIVINVTKENIDRFRNTSVSCYRNVVHDVYEELDSIQFKNRKKHFSQLHGIRWSLFLDDKIELQTGSKVELATIPDDCKQRLVKAYGSKVDVAGILKNGNPYLEEVITSTNAVNLQLKGVQEKLGLTEPFASLKINAAGEETIVNVSYLQSDPEEIEKILQLLFQEYNQQMQALPAPKDRNTEENKYALTFVAELFQNLEWLHPFFDGQGRTDLVLLSQLLVENGFNPAILYMPYLSTFEPLDKWISYLENGVEAWKIERDNLLLEQ